MEIVLGPILRFGGASDVVEGGERLWNVSVLVVVRGATPPTLDVDVDVDSVGAAGGPGLLGKVGAPTRIWASRGAIAYRFDLSIRRKPEDCGYVYRVRPGNGESRFVVPGTSSRARMAYASCNGFSSMKLMKSIDQKNALWADMLEKHRLAPHHLLLLGGDQIYADAMWETVQGLEEWNHLPFDEANKRQFTPELADAAERFFFDAYCKRLMQEHIRQALASIPTVAMWDDHDIFDGWGSYPPARQECPVYQGLFSIAREHFAVFQLQRSPDSMPSEFITPGGGFSHLFEFDGIALLVLDLRAERTHNRVVAPKSWDAIFRRLDAVKGARHLIVMSSIPVVYPDFGLVEGFLQLIPGQQELEDDLRDHWSSRPHRLERLRLIHRLLDFGCARRTRVTLVSGDVHVGALGVIESTRTGADDNTQVINQLISSAIVHPPPPGLLVFALDRLFEGVSDLDRGIRASMVKFPGTDHRIIGKRNWLSLEPDDRNVSDRFRLWANWHAEGESAPFTKVIHAATAT